MWLTSSVVVESMTFVARAEGESSWVCEVEGEAGLDTSNPPTPWTRPLISFYKRH